MTEPEKAGEQGDTRPKNATVMQCGGTDYHAMARSKEVREEYPNLLEPNRLKALEGVNIVFIATGSAACHSVACADDGRCFVWGRNEKGQLGLGDTHNRNVPVLLPASAVDDKKIVAAACGRHHTVLVTEDGSSYAMGLNAMGQCGTGSVKKIKGGEDALLTPHKCQVEGVSQVSCGAEFTAWLCEGKLWTAGLPQYGQLGHGSDHQYNASDSSVKMVFDPQPTPKPIVALEEKTVMRVACGHNHSVCLCSDGGVWTWGWGGYGRLGHRVQQDEFKPRLVEALTGRIQVPADATIGAGGSSSFCTIQGGQMYWWGKMKQSGDSQMYPTPLMDLAGWNIKSFSCGATTFGCAADKSVITWGQSSGHGELGYGEGGKKSSANPDKCMALEGVECYQVAMGAAHSLFLVDADDEKVKSAPVYDAQEVDDAAPEPSEKAGGKRKGAGGGRGGRGGGAKKKK